jgi:hypothetical protein
VLSNSQRFWVSPEPRILIILVKAGWAALLRVSRPASIVQPSMFRKSPVALILVTLRVVAPRVVAETLRAPVMLFRASMRTPEPVIARPEVKENRGIALTVTPAPEL